MAENSVPLAIVTGANRGLGLETCRQLGKQGWRVVLTARDKALGESAAGALREEGVAAEFHVLDVSDPKSAAALAATARESWGRVDALVNNAGVSLKGFNPEAASATLQANFYGALHVTDALLPLIGAGGRLVMVSSGLGELSCVGPGLRKHFSDPELTREQLLALMAAFIQDVEQDRAAEKGWPESAYRVSKVGLNALTRVLAREQPKNGPRINAVCPGWVRTDMGGRSASRGIPEGADTIAWAAMLPPDGPTGVFFRDRREVSW